MVKYNRKIPTHYLLFLLFVTLVLRSVTADALIFTNKASVNMRKGPGLDHQVVTLLKHNQTLTYLGKKGRWFQVETLSGKKGYVRHDMVSDIWIKVHKKERNLHVIKNNKTIKSYKVALCPSNPLGDKVKQGDGGTPEGRFYICEPIGNPGQKKYGARSMRLSYPNVEDARRGLKDKLISYDTYLGIVRQIKKGKIPNQKTPLGGSIRIHGGGNSQDWTLGCIALNDDDVVELFNLTGMGTRIEIYKSIDQDRKINSRSYLNRLIFEGAKRQLDQHALYTSEASGIIKLKYPMGDIRPDQAVCTDIVIRTLRNAGIDLQALIHENAIHNPKQYAKWVSQPNYHIDHRRTRNLQIFFTSDMVVLPVNYTSETKKSFEPGDIIVMDTGITNGTVFDHIGIIDSRLTNSNVPSVINIWTIGNRTDSMDLLGKTYPVVVGHFRATHLFDYL